MESYTTNMQILPGQGVAIIVMFNACDYFVSNAMAPRSPIYRLQADGRGAYVQTHAVIDGILPDILIVAVLPLFRLKNAARSGESGRARAATCSHSSRTRYCRR